MKHLFAARFTMVEACINTAESHAADWSGLPGFTEAYTELKALVPQMITAIGVNTQRVKPATAAKASMRSEIEAATLQLAGALSTHGLKTRDDNLRNEARLKPSYLKGASGNGLLGYATHRLAMAQALPAESLASFGFTTTSLKALGDKVQEFALFLSAPRDRRLEIKEGRETAEALMDHALRLLQDALDTGVSILSKDHPEFASKWKAARKVIKTAGRTRSLTIRVKDSNGAALEGAEITILPAGVERYSSQKGGAQVQNLVAGTYTAIVRHKDYVATEVPFTVYSGETTVLNVELGSAA